MSAPSTSTSTITPTAPSPSPADAAFLAWFTENGGTYAESAVGIGEFDETGRGAVALRDIQEGEKLFTIPRSLVLSTRTSGLPSLLGAEEWKTHGLDKGWAGLILCMMWEEARGEESKWKGYLEAMPTAFSTLMFWEPEELEYLRGSTVVDKIGKEDAERDYHEKVLPLMKSRTDLFPTEMIDTHYSLEKYHIQGSRILSRSFTVMPWSSAEGEGEGKDGDGDTLMKEVHVMGDEKDGGEEVEVEEEDGGEDAEEDDEERERVEDVGMVPMADMLNARYGCNNARLFYAKDDLQMVSTRRIKQGEQIWNTYGDPPNSDLLRRYGYVDAIKLQDGIGSPADVVEIGADLVVQAVQALASAGVGPEAGGEGQGSGERMKERIDWWLEEGGDDAFVLDTSYRLPDDLVQLVRLLQLSPADFARVREKSRPPKARLDERSYHAIREALSRRLSMYSLSLQDQESLLAFSREHLCEARRQALVVTSGEMRILTRAMMRLDGGREANLESVSRKRRAGSGSGDGGGGEKAGEKGEKEKGGGSPKEKKVRR